MYTLDQVMGEEDDKKCKAMLEILLEKESDRDISLMHLLALCDDARVVRFLCEIRPDLVNATDKNGITPLFYAIKYKSIEAAKCLIENNADLNARTENGNTPLHSAIAIDLDEVSSYLITKSADLMATNLHGITPMLLAAGKGNLTIMKLLLEHGVNPLQANEGGDTPADFATRSGKLEILKWLIEEQGADPLRKNSRGQTLLAQAAKASRNEKKEEGEAIVDYLTSTKGFFSYTMVSKLFSESGFEIDGDREDTSESEDEDENESLSAHRM